MIRDRDEARTMIFEKLGTSLEISASQKKSLHSEISACMRVSGCYMDTLRMNRMKKNGNMTCSSYNFSSREVVSFNRCGFVAMAGWADDTNVRPILDGIENWLGKVEATK